MYKVILNFFGINDINSTAATNVISILTFGIGLLFTLFYSWINDSFKRRHYRKMLELNTASLYVSMELQTNSYLKYQSQININNTVGMEFNQINITAIEIIEKLGYENLYDAFFRKNALIPIRNLNNKLKVFTELWNLIYFVKNTHQDSFIKSEDFLKNNQKENSLRNDSIRKCQLIVEQLRLEIHNTTPHKDLAIYFDKIEEIFESLYRQPNYSSPDVFDEHYVQKLLSLNRQNPTLVKTYSNVIQPTELNQALLETHLHYINQKNIFMAYSEYFKHLHNEYFSQLEKIKNFDIVFHLNKN